MSNGEFVREIERLTTKAETNQLRAVPGRTSRFYYFDANAELRNIAMPQSATPLRALDLTSLIHLASCGHARAILVGKQAVVVRSNVLVDVPDVVAENAPDPDPESAAALADLLTDPIADLTAPGATDTWTHELKLTHHPAYEVMLTLAKTREFTQKQLVRLCRTTLAGFIDPVEVAKLRSLDLKSETNGQSVVNNGDSGLSRQVVSQVRAANGTAVPEELTFSVPVYEIAEERTQLEDIRVIVEVTPGEGGEPPIFTLTALHNDVVAAEEAAQERIVATCRDAFPLVLRAELPGR